MKSYPSIETVFERDKETKRLNFEILRSSEVSEVREWTISEKIDGTNIRVIVSLNGIDVKGRGDNAQIHPQLADAVRSLFDHKEIVAFFTEYRGKPLADDWSVTFYGEGYGAGIQKKGVQYSPYKRFRCFDLMLGDSWWLDDSEMRRICVHLRIPLAPFICHTSVIPNTLDALRQIIPESIVALQDSGVHGIEPEGIVAKPLVVLLDRHGDRVIWKLTFREFIKQSELV